MGKNKRAYMFELFLSQTLIPYWVTQRIGIRLKIVKIIILADPKNWTILRKPNNVRNFSDSKNWDGVFWGPKPIKNLPDFACLQAQSTCIISILACKQR